MTREEAETKIKEIIKEKGKIYDKYKGKSMNNASPEDNERVDALNREMNRIDSMLRDGTYMFEDLEDEYKDFPALTGSEKQVKWAEDIRAKFFVAVNAEIKLCICDEDENGADYARCLGDDYIGKTSAKWWIEHRWEANDVARDYGKR